MYIYTSIYISIYCTRLLHGTNVEREKRRNSWRQRELQRFVALHKDEDSGEDSDEEAKPATASDDRHKNDMQILMRQQAPRHVNSTACVSRVTYAARLTPD